MRTFLKIDVDIQFLLISLFVGNVFFPDVFQLNDRDPSRLLAVFYSINLIISGIFVESKYYGSLKLRLFFYLIIGLFLVYIFSTGGTTSHVLRVMFEIGCFVIALYNLGFTVNLLKSLQEKSGDFSLEDVLDSEEILDV